MNEYRFRIYSHKLNFIFKDVRAMFSLFQHVYDVLGEFCCFTILDVFTYLGNLSFMKNCIANYFIIIFIYNKIN